MNRLRLAIKDQFFLQQFQYIPVNKVRHVDPLDTKPQQWLINMEILALGLYQGEYVSPINHRPNLKQKTTESLKNLFKFESIGHKPYSTINGVKNVTTVDKTTEVNNTNLAPYFKTRIDPGISAKIVPNE